VADHRTTSPSAFRIAVAQVELAGAPAHRAIHRDGTGPVQGALEGLVTTVRSALRVKRHPRRFHGAARPGTTLAKKAGAGVAVRVTIVPAGVGLGAVVRSGRGGVRSSLSARFRSISENGSFAGVPGASRMSALAR